MPEAKLCRGCQAALPEDAPEGLCPACSQLGATPTAAPTPVVRWQSGTSTPGQGFTAPRPADLAPYFPHLEILELLGQGGMGAVYKARQPRLDRLVALKILPPEADDPSFAERFTREARALAKLDHPNIITVYDFGESRGLYFFLMEYVDGVNLRQLMHAGGLQTEQALQIAPQICDALQFAHDEGIVHRDVKPDNILVDKKGRVKIADFGIAKLLGRDKGDPTLTGPAQVMGTLHYMAPEQMNDPLAVDHRADIYSLGVLLYEMLTRQLPLGRFAPPSQKALVDVRLDQVVMRALENEPRHRYQNVRDVKTAVEAITRERPAPWSGPPTRSWQKAAAPTTVQSGYEPAAPAGAGEPVAVGCFLPLVRVLAIPLCLLGALLVFAPWLQVKLTVPDALREALVPAANARAEIVGYRLPAGVAASALLFALGFVLAMTHRRLSIGRSLALMALSLVVAGLLAYVHVQRLGALPASEAGDLPLVAVAKPALLFDTALAALLFLVGGLELWQVLSGGGKRPEAGTGK